MNVLILSPYPGAIRVAVEAGGDWAETSEAPIDEALASVQPDWIVSYGYRHIIRAPVLARFPGRIVNLHISYLPWNRGADPNLWSWLDATPKGVTIHLIDAGIDTGPILAQAEIEIVSDATLATSYAALREGMEALFAREWPAIRTGEKQAMAQPSGGSAHRAAEARTVLAQLPLGWATPVTDVAALGQRLRD